VAWSWGFDAGSGEVWESDAAGCASLLELDDRELLLAAGLVRSGHWLRPQADALLELSLDDGCVDEALEAVAREPLSALVPPGLDCARLRLRVLPHRLLDARLAVCRATTAGRRPGRGASSTRSSSEPPSAKSERRTLWATRPLSSGSLASTISRSPHLENWR
jgi:hypothetical protein